MDDCAFENGVLEHLVPFDDWVSVLQNRESREEHVTLVADDFAFSFVPFVIRRAPRVQCVISTCGPSVAHGGGTFAAQVPIPAECPSPSTHQAKKAELTGRFECEPGISAAEGVGLPGPAVGFFDDAPRQSSRMNRDLGRGGRWIRL